jgi:cyclopropane-fatty-acyl-phospholipid synthase
VAQAVPALNPEKYLLYIPLLPNLLANKAFQDLIAVFRVRPDRVCFEQETMEGYRFVFEKVYI